MGDVAQAEIQSLRAQLAAAQAVAAEVALIKAINADLEARNALLQLQNDKMRRTLYGQRSERTRHLLDQMELTFEECEAAASEDEALAALAAAKNQRRAVRAQAARAQALARASAARARRHCRT